jgi:MGT family glycosyltransferase
LPELRKLEETFSPHAQISQQSEDFDFPNPSRPRHFHYVGLLRRAASDAVPFPFERLDGRPVLYASLGTVMGSAPGVYRQLAMACEGLPVQVVITLGGAVETAEHANLPGDPIVVRRAPQLTILRRAALTFCHAGLNTVLESLSFGVPVLALPMVTDQFAVGARLARSGAGEAITRKQFDGPALRSTISRLLTTPSYRLRAEELAISLRRSGGETRAADIIERAMDRVGSYSAGSAFSMAETSVVIPA